MRLPNVLVIISMTISALYVAINSQSLSDKLKWNDPYLDEQWHIYHRYRPGIRDINILPVWKKGIYGQGIKISLIDYLVYSEHPDLSDGMIEPLQAYNIKESNLKTVEGIGRNHATRCAGQIIATPNNKICGVGIAPMSTLSNFPLLSLDDPLANLSNAFSSDDSDIYSCSWGPPDDGKSFGGLSAEVFRTILKKIILGRKGRGSIFVVAAGNGGFYNDHCGADGFATNPFMISVGAISHLDRSPGYAERCPSMTIVTYSSSEEFSTEKIKKKSIFFSGISTSDKKSSCTKEHGGTSASAPIVTGAIALLLSQRPDLSWRDIQNILITSSVPLNNQSKYDDLTSFGKLDVERLLTIGSSWRLVNSPIFSLFTSHSVKIEDDSIFYFFFIEKSLYIERVLVKTNIEISKRGSLEFAIRSPSNTESILLGKRPLDDSNPRGNKIDIFDASLSGWVFTSLAFFHEFSPGLWTVRISGPALKNLSDNIFISDGIELAFISESEFNSQSPENSILFVDSVFSFYFSQEKTLVFDDDSTFQEWTSSLNIIMLLILLFTLLSMVVVYDFLINDYWN